MNFYRRFFLTLSILFTASSFAQQNKLGVVEIKTDIYEISYSQVYQQPLSIKYTVLCNSIASEFSRSGITFKEVNGIKTSTSSDYVNNVWDKGHMAPANTFSCREDWLNITFSYANCALQHQSLNRGAWASLERFERDLASIYDGVEIEIYVYFSEDWTTNSDPARIPSSFVKTISWIEDNGNYKSISFDFPNKHTNGKSFWAFKLQ